MRIDKPPAIGLVRRWTEVLVKFVLAEKSYRPDIDGLRAVAVASVVLYHAKVPWLPGGFVGVDIFFVISGYLITSLVVADLEASRFTLTDFYERRVRRIIPALAAVVASSLIAGYILMTPKDFVTLAKTAFASLWFHSNIWLASEAGYFMPAAETLPLLHTWSLGVEEQFYVLAPLFLMLLVKVPESLRRGAFLALLAAAIGLSIYLTDRDPDRAFYLLQTRAFELMIGMALALKCAPVLASRGLREVATLAGLGACALAFLVYDANVSFPGPAALLPCLGAALIIHGGSAAPFAATIVGTLLSSAPFTFLGRISYSLYLWHWPILVFGQYASPEPLGGGQRALLVALAAAVSVLSYYAIEQPVRTVRVVFTRARVFGGALALGVTLSALCLLVIHTDGLKHRLSAETQVFDRRVTEIAREKRACKRVEGIPAGKRACGLGVDGPPRFLVWGDSHAGSLYGEFDRAAQVAGTTGLIVTRGGCAPLLVEADHPALHKRKCTDNRRVVLDALSASKSIDAVILVARWKNYAGEGPLGGKQVDLFRQSLLSTIQDLSGRGVRIIVIGPIPEPGIDLPSAMIKEKMGLGTVRLDDNVARFNREQAAVITVLDQVKTINGVLVLAPSDDLCDTATCATIADGLPLYRDDNHLNSLGSQRLEALVSSAIAKATTRQPNRDP